jgi:pilus assembly protein Flp/PilA
MYPYKCAQRVRRFLLAEDGPTAVEYAVMLALIIIVALTAVQTLGTRTSATFNYVSTQIPAA